MYLFLSNKTHDSANSQSRPATRCKRKIQSAEVLRNDVCTQAIDENQAEFQTFFDCLIAFEFVKYLKGEEYVLKILL